MAIRPETGCAELAVHVTAGRRYLVSVDCHDNDAPAAAFRVHDGAGIDQPLILTDATMGDWLPDRSGEHRLLVTADAAREVCVAVIDLTS